MAKIPKRYEQDFTGFLIPVDILKDNRLTTSQKIIASLDANNMEYMTIKETAEFCDLSISSVTEAIKKLKETGYIKESNLSPQEIKTRVLERKKSAKMICEWCGCRCNVLNEHHYPISKANGGTETVKICPNCHCEFHSIEKGNLWEGENND